MITKPISGCIRIACSGLMITSLLQVVNRLAASCELHARRLDASCFMQASLVFPDLMQWTIPLLDKFLN